MTANQLYRWENGQAPVALERFVEICIVLETTPNDLLGFETIEKVEAA